MSATAPPGWYVDPATGWTRWWDGASWHDAAVDHGRTPGVGGRRRRRTPRRRTIVLVVAISFVVVVLMGGCIAASVRSKGSFGADTAGLADQLLQPADLDGTWEARALDAPPPVGPPFSRSAHRVGHVCPDAQEELTRALVSSGEPRAAGSSTIAQTGLARPASGTDSDAGYVQEAILAYWLKTDADDAFLAFQRSRSCTTTWDYTAPDDSSWRVRNETVDSRRFGPNVLVARTTYTPVDPSGPGGEPAPADGATEYLNVVSHDRDQILLLSMAGLSLEEAETVFLDAQEKLVR